MIEVIKNNTDALLVAGAYILIFFAIAILKKQQFKNQMK